MKKYIPFILLILLVSFAGPCYAEPKNITIVFTGDTRGELENCHCPKNDFGGFERRSNYINEVGQDVGEILLLDVGDVLPLFNPEFTRKTITYNAFISLKAMDLIGYDAMNAGESDIILGEKFLLEKSRNLKFPVISSNIVYKPTNQPYFKPYVIKTMKNGLKVGIIGVTNERYVINSKNLEVMPNKEIVAKYVEELRGQVDLVVVLGHIGLPYSEDLARAVDGIDVILSGHWDTENQEPTKAGKTIIMPSVSHSRKVGRLDLEIESEGAVSSYEWQSTPLDAKYDGDSFIKKLALKMPGAIKQEEEKPVAPVREVIEEQKPILADADNSPGAGKPLRVIVFYAIGCRSCMEVERAVLPGIEAKYGEKIIIEKYDIGISRNYAQMTRLEKLYGAEGGYVPEIIVSRYVLMGEKGIKAGLDKVIEKTLTEPENAEATSLTKEDVAAYEAPGAADSLILQRFASFSAFTVGMAGFLDGLNPCAFTTIVFFISFLAFVGYRKREMILAGSFFTIAVFIAYFLIGLGIFKFLRSVSVFNYAALAINIIIGSLAFVLGILSIADYFKFRKTHDTKTSMLQLPQSIKNKIHSIIGGDFRQDKKGRRKDLLKIAWIAFTSGFAVSILESICTGQVYLPTIAYVLRMPDKHISALSYLLIYNVAFIVPLVIVFMLGLFGATSGAFSKFMQKHFGFVKLSTAALFFVLAAVLVIFK
ncbi:MAG: metallophosphoesterase [Candidatus Omnitrophica bacterium]|nr:metallophosphoesterase [Candidatus Omnitrophota bacterium]